jgi:asparagine synthase (glutamine-hydrolysing)
MCGLVGFLERGTIASASAGALVRAMGERITHRGPDDSGTWVDAQAGIALAHRRLSIVDLSPAGHQPMHSHSGRFVVVFNGEIYNHKQLRERLDQSGATTSSWRGNSDTEVMLAAFDAWGIEQTLKECIGMFAMAVWDRAKRELILARDRVGEKPLYYGWQGETFLFASQMKAFRPHPSFRGEIDRDAITLLLRHSYVPAPFSIYKGILKLPPGTFFRLTEGRREGTCHQYWSLDDAAAEGNARPFTGNEQSAAEALETRLSEAVALQMVADVPLGAFLSGGIDSSTIVALMQKLSSRPVKTFTIGFNERGYDEARYAKAVAHHLGTEHTELYVSPEQARSVIPELPEIYDEPFSDSSQIPTFLVSQMARRDVTVSLSGDGGDELFGGYHRYFLGGRIRKILNLLPLPFRKAVSNKVMAMSPEALNLILRPLGLMIPYFNVNQPSDKAYKAMEVFPLPRDSDVYRRLVSHWDKPESLVLQSREPQTTLDHMLGRRGLADSFEQWMMTTDMQTYLPDDILAKVDRAAMAVGLETRVPFLDHRLIEFSLSLPLRFKIRGGKGKWLLRQVLYKHVPKHLVERPKMGFGIPMDSWLRGPLKDWAESLLNERTLLEQGFLNPDPIRQKWKEHVAGTHNWQFYLWDVLMFQAWLAKRT